MLSVNESTIKRWIDRGLLPASRTPGGHRRVSTDDLEQFLKKQPKARKHSYTLARLGKQSETHDWKRYYDLHLSYSPNEARTYLTGAYLASGAVLQVLEQVVIPALVNIGVAWRNGEIDIADEHRMTFLIRADLLALEALLPLPTKDAPTALLACVPGENHELTLQMLAIVARTRGWKSVVLGINVPAAEIERVVKKHKINRVFLAKQYRKGLQTKYVEEVRGMVPTRIPVTLGGAGWSEREKSTLTKKRGVNYVESFRVLQDKLTTA